MIQKEYVVRKKSQKKTPSAAVNANVKRNNADDVETSTQNPNENNKNEIIVRKNH